MLLPFCSSLFIFYLLFGLISFSVSAVSAKSSAKTRVWPSLWVTAITASTASAILTALLLAMPEWHPNNSLNIAIAAPLSSGIGLEARWAGQVTPSSNVETKFTLLTIYIVGVLVSLTRLFNGRSRAHQILNDSKPCQPIDSIAFNATAANVAPFVITPIFRPVGYQIVLPNLLVQQLTEQDIRLVLKHELEHVNHADDRVGFALRVLIAFSWFVPFAHMMFKRWAADIELRCDSLALKHCSDVKRSDYANVVLKAHTMMVNGAAQYPAASFSANHFNSEKKRIKSILQGDVTAVKSPNLKRIMIGSFSVIALLLSAVLSVKADDHRLAVSDLLGEGQQRIISGRLTAKFGISKAPFNANRPRIHRGVDIAAPIDTPIYAPADGIIIAATNRYDDQPNYGKVVVIETVNGIQTLFAHLNRFDVHPGQSVKAGTTLGTVGNTGKSTKPHVHLETFAGTKRIDPFTIWRLTE